jgi:hypothetical protein
MRRTIEMIPSEAGAFHDSPPVSFWVTFLLIQKSGKTKALIPKDGTNQTLVCA